MLLEFGFSSCLADWIWLVHSTPFLGQKLGFAVVTPYAGVLTKVEISVGGDALGTLLPVSERRILMKGGLFDGLDASSETLEVYAVHFSASSVLSEVYQGPHPWI
jgi:hypothetical protein